MKGRKVVYLLALVTNAVKTIITKLTQNAPTVIDHCSFYLQDSNPVPSEKNWKTNEAHGEWTLLPHYHSLHAPVSVSTEFKHLSQ